MRRSRLLLFSVCILLALGQLYLYWRYHTLIGKVDFSGRLGRVATLQLPRSPLPAAQHNDARPSGQLLLPDGPIPRLSDGQSFGPGNEAKGCVASAAPEEAAAVVAAVVVVTCCRAGYLERTLNALVDVHAQEPGAVSKFPLFVSQDGSNSEVAETLHAFAPTIKTLQHVELNEPVRQLNEKENLAYYRIANHYKFIFAQFFDCFHFPKLIILEDDMEVAVDFFSYFEATARLLDADPSLYAVSSWNDHGQERYVADATRLYRSDFFPGLGWMMPAALWDEFRDVWPYAYWDDWMRLASVRKERHSIYPEVSRNYNFGEHGASKGQYFRQYLKPIKLNTVAVDWAAQDFGYLAMGRYEADLRAAVDRSQLVSSVVLARDAGGDVKLQYSNEKQFKRLARSLGIIPDWKDGIPRASFQRIVQLRLGNAHLFLVPAPDFKPPPAEPLPPPSKQQPRKLGGAAV